MRVRDIATVQFGPEIRRGAADLNGRGDAVGGIVVMRVGSNALEVIEAVEREIARLTLPPGVRFVPTYDRSELIHKSVETLTNTLIQEGVIVALVCLVFLFNLRSALVAIVTIPLAVLFTFLPPFMVLVMRGRFRAEAENPIARLLKRAYRPVVRFAVRARHVVLVAALALFAITVPVAMGLGSEFMPPLDEGSLLVMPTTFAGISIEEARRALAYQNRVIMGFEEVASVHGKVGRA